MTDNRKWRPKPEILISLKLWKVQLKFQWQLWGIRSPIGGNSFSKWVQQRPRTGNIDMAAKTGNNYISGTLTDSSNAKFRIFDDIQLDRRFTKWLQQRSTTRDCTIGEQNVYILPFPVVGRCRNRPGSVSSRWAWSKTPDLPLELSSYLL